MFQRSLTAQHISFGGKGITTLNLSLPTDLVTLGHQRTPHQLVGHQHRHPALIAEAYRHLLRIMLRFR